MTLSNRRTYNGRLTIGRSKKAYHWWESNIGSPTIGWFWIRSKKGYDWCDSNVRWATIGWFWIWEGQRLFGVFLISEVLRLVVFKYQKGYDWLESKFHCSYLESREVPKKKRGKYGKKRREIISLLFPVPVTSLPVTSFLVTSGYVISCDATSGNATSGDDPPHDPTQM